MKNLFKILAIAMVAYCSMFMSCKKSNESLIKEYGELRNEIVAAAKDGDAAKIATLSKKGEELAKEMDSREFTEEEQAQIINITSEISEAVLSASGAQEMMQGLSDMMNDDDEEDTPNEDTSDEEE